MTDNEIVKALECCATEGKCEDVDNLVKEMTEVN